MFKVICRLENASHEINGVPFVDHEAGVISAGELDAETAGMFEGINGYEIVPSGGTRPAAVTPRAPTQGEGGGRGRGRPSKAEAEAARLAALANETIAGDAGADSTSGADGDDSLAGQDADDSISGADAADGVEGEAGADSIADAEGAADPAADAGADADAF